jgi:hypothetical protein
VNRAERYATQRAQALQNRPPHPFDGDPEQGKDWRGNFLRCRCGMPRSHRVHDEQAIAAAVAAAQEVLVEEQRRLGEAD